MCTSGACTCCVRTRQEYMPELAAPLKSCCRSYCAPTRTLSTCKHTSCGEGVLLQVLGEIFHRMVHIRDFPSRLAAADCVALPQSLQPGLASVEQPAAAFPSAGFYKHGKYHAVIGCKGNLVNVRSQFLLWPPSLLRQHACPTSQQLSVYAATTGSAGAVAGALDAPCGRPSGEVAAAEIGNPEAGVIREFGGCIEIREDANPPILSRSGDREPCAVVPHACLLFCAP